MLTHTRSDNDKYLKVRGGFQMNSVTHLPDVACRTVRRPVGFAAATATAYAFCVGQEHCPGPLFAKQGHALEQ